MNPFNKQILVWLAITLPSPWMTHVNAQFCGNNQRGGPTAPCDCIYSPCASDPISVYSGDEQKQMNDLVIWGGVGEHQLIFTRYAHSRDAGAVGLFGNAHSWRHRYEWEMEDIMVSPGHTLIYITYPNGKNVRFDKHSPTEWLPPTAVGDILYQSTDTDYYLQTADGFRYHFIKTITPYGDLYQMIEFADSQSNTYPFIYNANGQLTKVSEPGGRYIQISYNTNGQIKQVTSNDGRTETYQYSTLIDIGSPGVTYTALTGVTYDDGTAAAYTYTQIASGTRPLVSSWVDPRNKQPLAKSRTSYYALAGYPVGVILNQIGYDSGHIITTIGEVDGNPSLPSATYPDGGVAYSYMAYGTNTFSWDKLNRATIRTYAKDGVGYFFDPSDNWPKGYRDSHTDPLGHTTQWQNSPFGHPLVMIYPDGSTEQWTRDNLDLILTYTDPLGHVSTYTRDNLHRIIRIDYPDASYETFTYNSFAEILFHRTRNGGTEKMTYDATGLLTSKIDVLDHTWSYTYDAAGRPASVTEPNSHITNYQYNTRGLLTKTIFADGTTRQTTYTTFGDKATDIDELGHITSYTYDEYRRMTSITDGLGRVTQYSYGLLGGTGCSSCHIQNNITRVTFPSGKAISFDYDLEWQRTSMTAGAGSTDAATTTYTYDSAGNVASMTDPLGHVTTYTYDSRNRKITQTDPLSRTTAWTYDAASNILTVQRPDGGVTTNTYDAVNRLASTTDPKGQTTIFTYDNADNIASLTNANGNTTIFTYDLFNRRTKKIHPDMSFEQWTYDDTANISQPFLVYRNPAGNSESTYYTLRNRVAKKTYSDSTPAVTYTYDAAGRMLTMTSSVSSLVYSYDAADEMLSESQNIFGSTGAKIVTYAYDADGNNSSLAYPDGTMVTYTYTNRDQVASIASTLKPGQQANYTYDANGKLTTRSLDNATMTSYAYDGASRLVQLTQAGPAGTFETLHYSYNSMNDRTSKQTINTIYPSGSYEIYAYDAVDQVIESKYNATAPSGAGATRDIFYTLDPMGNRTAVNDTGINTTYTPNNLNQYMSVGNAALTYDSNGNLVSGLGTYTYDAKNRLVSATVDGTTMTLAYDGRNRCVSRSEGPTTTYFIYDNWHLISEYEGAAPTPSQTYVQGLVVDEMIAKKNASGAVVYYCSDALGSITYLTDPTGAIAEHYIYDIYGNTSFFDGFGSAVSTSSMQNRFLFTGREYLAEIKLYDYRNRFYSANLGRWTSRDPIGEMGGINLYSYVLNNPVRYLDPSGLDDPTMKPAAAPYGPLDNCYSYAMGTPVGNDKTKMKNDLPGGRGGFDWKGKPVNCANLIAAAKADGAVPPDEKGCCPKDFHKIQIVKQAGNATMDDPNTPDFHVFRGGQCGIPTSSLLTNQGNPMIVDNASADFKSFKDKYPEDCGQLCAPGN